MATVITELNMYRRQAGDRFCINFTSGDVSSTTTIKAGEANKRIWVDNISVTLQSGGTVGFRIFNGADTLIGPITMQSGIPWKHKFPKGVNLALGNSLRVKTQSAVAIHILVDGIIDVDPDISPSSSSSPSPSPSE